jgi:hypothetical protein
MWEFFDLFIQRTAEVFISSLQMLGEDVGTVMKIDAMIGRATHILNRSGNEQHRFPRCECGARGALESERDGGRIEGTVGLKTNASRPSHSEKERKV